MNMDREGAKRAGGKSASVRGWKKKRDKASTTKMTAMREEQREGHHFCSGEVGVRESVCVWESVFSQSTCGVRYEISGCAF